MQLPRVMLNNQIYIITPKKNITYEDTFYRQSFFTKTIIKYIEKYHSKFSNDLELNRYIELRKLVFSKMLKTSFTYIYGDSGIGKSYFLRQIEENETDTYYVSIPNLNNLTYNIVLTLISEKIRSRSADKVINTDDANPERFIRFFANNNPHCQLIIDHMNHLSDIEANNFMQFLNEIPSAKLIASSRIINRKSYINYFKFLVLTAKDIDAVTQNFPHIIHKLNYEKLYSQKNYIDLLNFIYENNKAVNNRSLSLTVEFQKAYKAIAISGGFINLYRFSSHFNIPINILHNLLNKGILVQHDLFFYPHDKIYEVDVNATEIQTYQGCAKTYWMSEIENSEKTTKACHSFILLIKTFDIEFKNSECSFYKKLISALKGRQNTYYLLIVYNYLSQNQISDSLKVLLCEALIDIGKFDEAFYLISSTTQPNLTLIELETELLWWKGQFEQCVKTTSCLLNKMSNTNLLCSRGIGYFFLGKWDESQEDLIIVIQEAALDNLKQRYLSYCVIATIQGIRGTDFLNCSKNFIEAIKIAKKSGKLAWLSLIYGNIGEIFWKGSLYQEAFDILKMAKHLAYLTDNKALLLEINRNLLHTYHRSEELSTVKNLITELEAILKKSSDNYVNMQIINSLITHYIFTNNDKYLSLLSRATTLTQNNNEYYIYTLSNHALITLISNFNLNRAVEIMHKALELCYKGKNWLAIKQCLDDWDQCINIYKLTHPLSEQAFQKWRLMLEKELTPHLHHLFDLHEYLLQH